MFLSLLTVFGYAEAPSEVALSCLNAFHRLAHPKFDSAVELEMVSDPAVLKLFGSRTGTVRGILPQGDLPEHIKTLFPGKSEAEILRMEWRDLSAHQQLEILTEGGKRKSSPFFLDRVIPNVKYEEGFFADVPRRTVFLDKEYQPGLHTIRPKEFMKGNIEYMGPHNYPGGVELHFRLAKPAGDTSQEARKFQELIGVEPTHQHVYIVSPIPQKKLEKKPEVVAVRNADFYRRVNLASEMITIMEDGSPITERVKGSGKDQIYIFGSLRPDNLVQMANYLVEHGKGNLPLPLKDKLKIAWVGFRGEDKFDSPGLMGMEFRSIYGHTDLEVYRRFLNTVQKSWVQQNLGLPQSNIEEWLTENYQGDYEKALKDSWYQKEWKDVISKAPRDLKDEMGWWGLRKLSKKLGSSNQEVKMLFHDWSHDPLFFNNLEKQQTIRSAQIQAIRLLNRNSDSINSIMQDFLLSSGLYESVLNSLYSAR